MSHLHLNEARAMTKARRAAIRDATRVVTVGREVMAENTPVLSGKGRNSVHDAVIDDQGRKVYGDATDGNGNATPNYPGQSGVVLGIVASNEGADDGEWYLHYVNDGVRGRSGVLMKEQARAAMDAERKR